MTFLSTPQSVLNYENNLTVKHTKMISRFRLNCGSSEPDFFVPENTQDNEDDSDFVLLSSEEDIKPDTNFFVACNQIF